MFVKNVNLSLEDLSIEELDKRLEFSSLGNMFFDLMTCNNECEINSCSGEYSCNSSNSCDQNECLGVYSCDHNSCKANICQSNICQDNDCKVNMCSSENQCPQNKCVENVKCSGEKNKECIRV